jgi:hypothetical protein
VKRGCQVLDILDGYSVYVGAAILEQMPRVVQVLWES